MESSVCFSRFSLCLSSFVNVSHASVIVFNWFICCFLHYFALFSLSFAALKSATYYSSIFLFLVFSFPNSVLQFPFTLSSPFTFPFCFPPKCFGDSLISGFSTLRAHHITYSQFSLRSFDTLSSDSPLPSSPFFWFVSFTDYFCCSLSVKSECPFHDCDPVRWAPHPRSADDAVPLAPSSVVVAWPAEKNKAENSLRFQGRFSFKCFVLLFWVPAINSRIYLAIKLIASVELYWVTL